MKGSHSKNRDQGARMARSPVRRNTPLPWPHWFKLITHQAGSRFKGSRMKIEFWPVKWAHLPSPSIPLHPSPSKFLGTSDWRVVSCTWWPVLGDGGRGQAMWMFMNCLLLSSLPGPTCPVWEGKQVSTEARSSWGQSGPHAVVALLSQTSACLLNTPSLPCLLSMSSLLRWFSHEIIFPTATAGTGHCLGPPRLCDRAPAPREILAQCHLPPDVPRVLGRLGAWVAGKRGYLIANSCPSEVLTARTCCSENSGLCRKLV